MGVDRVANSYNNNRKKRVELKGFWMRIIKSCMWRGSKRRKMSHYRSRQLKIEGVWGKAKCCERKEGGGKN